MYKVVIPSAGIGSRIGTYTKFMNKALVSIQNRPAITHIIDKFPDANEIIILVGYKGDYVKQVVSAFYPDRNIRFIDVDLYEGPGSSLGYTLSCAREHLQCPFIFTSNDTVLPNDCVNIDPNIHGNWMGYSTSEVGDISQYRTLDVVYDRVGSINPKGILNCPNIYIGVAGIKDYSKFWDALSDVSAAESGESYAMKFLTGIRAVKFNSWCDIGNLESLHNTRKRLDDGKFNILEKDNEAIWFKDGYAFKFSIDTQFIADRVQRSLTLNDSLYPKICFSTSNMYVYKMASGDVIGKNFNSVTMRHVLNRVWSQMWEPNRTPATPALITACYDFYKKKTTQRVKLYLTKYEIIDQPDIINGVRTLPALEMLERLDWSALCETPMATHFHGDFHNENILVNDQGEPVLIDWRQNFGPDNLEIGDAYYDFAKFYHGLLVSHAVVHRELYEVRSIDTNEVHISIMRPSELVDGEQAYIEWMIENGIDVQKVRVLTALIFLNIAALHEFPYSKYLFYLGKHLLSYYHNINNEHSNW
jgi:choline kinase/thiamine kinase-like enzyme